MQATNPLRFGLQFILENYGRLSIPLRPLPVILAEE